MDLGYKGKVCVVTGAASGIGLAAIKMLRENEGVVYALDVNEINVEGVISISVDLNSKESIDLAFEKIPQHIDYFFGVAGLSGARTNYYTTFTVNYIANKYITEEYLKKRMTNGGAIAYVTSVAGCYWEKYAKEYQLFTRAKTWEEMRNVLEYQAKESTVGLMAYPLSKRALNHYMAEMAIELGEKGIRVNALLPGSTDTGMKDEFEVEAGGNEALISQTGIAKRLATPEEMAAPLLFLNSKMAGFINGLPLIVDYGNDALIKLGRKKDRLDTRVNLKIFNSKFMQNMFKKQLAPLDDKEDVKQEDLTADIPTEKIKVVEPNTEELEKIDEEIL